MHPNLITFCADGSDVEIRYDRDGDIGFIRSALSNRPKRTCKVETYFPSSSDTTDQNSQAFLNTSLSIGKRPDI